MKLADLFRQSQDDALLVKRVAALEVDCQRLDGLYKQLRRVVDEVDEAVARRLKKIAARNGASATEAPSPAAEPEASSRATWRERLRQKRGEHGNAAV